MQQHNKPALMRIIRYQLVIGIVGFLLFAAAAQLYLGSSYMAGVVMMAVNSWWLAARLDRTADLSVAAGQRSLYAGAAIRFVSLIVGLVLAQWAGLHLLLVAAGMFVAQAVIFVSALAGFARDQAVADEKNIKKDQGDGFG